MTGNISGGSLTGTLVTNAQPNITTIGQANGNLICYSKLQVNDSITAIDSINTSNNYKISNTSVLTSDTLGSNIVNSSITSCGISLNMASRVKLQGDTFSNSINSSGIGSINYTVPSVSVSNDLTVFDFIITSSKISGSVTTVTYVCQGTGNVVTSNGTPTISYVHWGSSINTSTTSFAVNSNRVMTLSTVDSQFASSTLKAYFFSQGY